MNKHFRAHLLAAILIAAVVAGAGCGSDVTPVDDIEATDIVEVSPDVPDTTDAVQPRLCNGLAELCDRPLDQVVFATTHNAMANTQDGFGMPNQETGVATSLTAGVRAFMLDTHYLNTEDPPLTDDVYLCHGLCVFGYRPLTDTLNDIRVFLEANPDEVVAIIFESYVTSEHAKVSFDAANVTDMLIVLDPAQPIPTMAETIDAGRRILVLSDGDGGGFPGYLPVWDWAWDNDWDNKIPADLDCDNRRGSYSNPFFILNHFLTDPTALPELAQQVNFNPFLLERALGCWATRGDRPNFVTVDFYEIGDVLDVVRTLNLAESPN